MYPWTNTWEFKSNLKLGHYREEYKFLSPKTENKNFLPTGAVLSFLIAVIIYSGWYYSERNKTKEIVSNQIIESKKANNYTIIEEKENFNKLFTFQKTLFLQAKVY